MLHDQGEVPQMKDQGFAVSPGTHTLVGVEQYRVHNYFQVDYIIFEFTVQEFPCTCAHYNGRALGRQLIRDPVAII